MSDFAKDKDVLISRKEAIYLLEHEIELSNRALDFAELVGTEREKFSWGLGLLESIAEDIKQLPSAEPEIIRCHECAKRRTLDCPMGITVFDAPPSDGYCYKAERRR